MLLVSYDLRKKGSEAYEALKEALTEHGSFAQVLESAWLLDTDADPTDVGRRLVKVIGDDDRLMIVAIDPDSMATHFPSHPDGLLPDDDQLDGWLRDKGYGI